MQIITVRDKVLNRIALQGILQRKDLRQKLGLPTIRSHQKFVSWDQIIRQLRKCSPPRADYVQSKLAEKGIGTERQDILRREARFGDQEASVGQLLNRKELRDQADLAATGRVGGYQYPLPRILSLAKEEGLLTEQEYQFAVAMQSDNIQTADQLVHYLKRKELTDQETIGFICSFLEANYQLARPLEEMQPIILIIARIVCDLCPHKGEERLYLARELLKAFFKDQSQALFELLLCSLLKYPNGKKSLIRALHREIQDDGDYYWGHYIGHLAALECGEELAQAIGFISDIICLSFDKLDPLVAGKIAFGAAKAFTNNPEDLEAVFETIAYQLFIEEEQRATYMQAAKVLIQEPDQEQETIYIRQEEPCDNVLNRGAGGKEVSLREVLAAAGKQYITRYLPKELANQTFFIREQDEEISRPVAKQILQRRAIRQALGMPEIIFTAPSVPLVDIMAKVDKYLEAMISMCKKQGLDIRPYELMDVNLVVKDKRFPKQVKAIALVRHLFANIEETPDFAKIAGKFLGELLGQLLPERNKSQANLVGETAKIIFTVDNNVLLPACYDFILSAVEPLSLLPFSQHALFFWGVERILSLPDGSLVGYGMKQVIGHTPSISLQQTIIEELLRNLKLEPAQARAAADGFYRAIAE